MEPSHLNNNEVAALSSAIQLCSDAGAPTIVSELQRIVSRHTAQPQCVSTRSINGWTVRCDNNESHFGMHHWVGNNGHLSIEWDRA